MGMTLPSELWMSLEDSCPCRSIQLRQLTALHSDIYPPPRNLVVYGLQGTGKLHTVLSVLAARQIVHAVIKSKECLSLRHLLSKILTACKAAVYQSQDNGAEDAFDSRCESVNALSVYLQRLFQSRDEKLVVVLDGIDKQRGLHPHTLPALARLSDIIPNLCLVLVVTTPRPLFLQKSGIPYLHFPPYTRAEAISLVTRSSPRLAPQQHLDSHQNLPLLQKWYSLFATTVYDSLFSQTSLSLSQFRRACEGLWPRFVWPYINGDQPPGKAKNAEWDFAKLLVRQRALFQAAGEDSLAARLLPKDHATTFEELQGEEQTAEQSLTDRPPTSKLLQPGLSNSQAPTSAPSTTYSQPFNPPLLPLFSTILLTAAYLASHTPPKLDILLFSRLSSSSRSARVKKSYHRRKLFQSPSKRKGPTTGAGGETGGETGGGEGGGGGGEGPSTPRKKKTATLGKSGLELNLNLPRSFTLDRLVAILRAIHPQGVSRGRSVVDKVCKHLAELETLRLVVPADGAGGGGGTARALDDGAGEGGRWRVNVPRRFVEDLGGRYAREGLEGLLREFELIEG